MAASKALELYVNGNLIKAKEEAIARAERAEARVKELETELAHSILDATAQLVESKARAVARVKELKATLEDIAGRDWVENALDPQWSASCARAALVDKIQIEGER